RCMATAPTATYPLSLHDALPIFGIGQFDVEADLFLRIEHGSIGREMLDAQPVRAIARQRLQRIEQPCRSAGIDRAACTGVLDHRSEEHTSELQSRENLVCRLLLE